MIVTPTKEAERVILRTAAEIETERLARKAAKAKRLNRIKRVLGEIEGNAKKATPGPWAISHSHVIKSDQRGTYDIASRPYDRDHCVYGVNPYADPTATDDMRYIATVDPQKMLKLVEDIREVLGLTDAEG